MKKVALFSITSAFCLALITVFTVFGLFAKSLLREPAIPSESDELKLLSEDEDIKIPGAASSDYALIFSSDSVGADQTLATLVGNKLAVSGVYLFPTPDVGASETDREILIGRTNRALSEELYETVMLEANNDERYAWGIAYRDGKLAFLASSENAYEVGQSLILDLIDESGSMKIPADLYVIDSITPEDYKKKLESEKLEKYHALNAEFKDSELGVGTFNPILGANGIYEENPYERPWIYPTEGEHPRLLFGEHRLEEIRVLLDDPEYKGLRDAFWTLANADESKHYNGRFKTEYKNGVAYNYSGEILAMMEAKSLAYLLTGNESYAVEATVMIKNAMLTLNFTSVLHGDTYRGSAHVMCIAAKVYDWCYDALSENDKEQIASGVVTILAPGLEDGMKYPPNGMSGSTGHGLGPQLINSWLFAAIAFSDEYPYMWEFVGGRFFEEYLPSANRSYLSGNVIHGTAIYGPIKLYCMSKAMYSLKALTGEMFWTEEAKNTGYFFMSHDMSNGRYFQTGDGTRTTNGARMYYEENLWVAALYNDPVLYAYAREQLNNHTRFSYDNIMQISPALQLILASDIDYSGEQKRDGIDTVQFFDYPAGQMTVRESWDDPDSLTVFMKIGNETNANHDQYDSGTFQIYYKGLLAGTSGQYNLYGSAHHFYYHQMTVAHNGLLVFNPSFASLSSKDPSSYFYSGSQDRHSTFEKMSETVGAAWGYDEDGKAKYAYIAGDLTEAYNASTVEYIERSMMTLYTGDEDIRALFVTYDKITSMKESYQKTWLLHTLNEPTVNETDLSATVTAGGGKMYVKSLFGANSIVKIGGEGKAYWINGYYSTKGEWVDGKNATDQHAPTDMYETVWGRIELRAPLEKSANMLTVMGITDLGNESGMDVSGIETDTVHGLTFSDYVIAFARSSTKQYKEFSFTTDGLGLHEYYVAGLEAGTWQIKVDGTPVAYAVSVEREGLISFIAPAGELTVTPCQDVIGANGGKIVYNTGGGLLPEDAPFVYNNENDTPLPETLGGDIVFKGWYTSPGFEPETKIDSIPAGTTGTFKVYAFVLGSVIYEDFTSTEIDSGTAYTGIDYKGSDVYYKTLTDESGVKYLEWVKYSDDAIICRTSTTDNLSTVDERVEALTFEIKLKLHHTYAPMKTNFNLLSRQDTDGNALSKSVQPNIFTTNTEGEVYLGGATKVDTLSKDEVTTLRVVLDAKYGYLRYYDDDLKPVAQVEFVPPAQTNAPDTWSFLSTLKEYVFYWYAGKATDTALCVYSIAIYEGDRYASEKADSGNILYETNAGTLPADAPTSYDPSVDTPLPTPTLDGAIFAGWYTTPTFDDGSKVYSIPVGTEGVFAVYAKWFKTIVSVDYGKVDDIDITEATGGPGRLDLKGEGKAGSSYKTVYADDGSKYLLWTPGTSDSMIVNYYTGRPIASMKNNTVSYLFRFGKNGDRDTSSYNISILAKQSLSGANISDHLYFAYVSGGKVYLSDKGTSRGAEIATLSPDEETFIRISIDFETGTISAYGERGEVIAATTFAPPPNSGATTTLECKSCFINWNLYMRHTGASSGSGKSLKVFEISIIDGNPFI